MAEQIIRDSRARRLHALVLCPPIVRPRFSEMRSGMLALKMIYKARLTCIVREDFSMPNIHLHVRIPLWNTPYRSCTGTSMEIPTNYGHTYRLWARYLPRSPNWATLERMQASLHNSEI